MRWLGIAILGLFSGLLIGFVAHEIIARIAISGTGQFPDSLPLALLVGYLTPALGIAGVVVALVIDSRAGHRNESS